MPTSNVHQAERPQPHSSMMAWRVHEFGPPNVMRFERVLRPDPGPGEVLVKVEAAGVGPWDGLIRAGKSASPRRRHARCRRRTAPDRNRTWSRSCQARRAAPTADNSGVSPSTSTLWGVPLIFNSVAGADRTQPADLDSA